MGTIVPGVVETVSKDELNKYVTLFREPDTLDTTHYEDQKCIMKKEHNTSSVSNCYESEIVNNYTTGKCIPRPNLLQCNSDYKSIVDPADFYKKQYRAIITPLEDSVLQGYNYQQFDSFLQPKNLNKLLFDKNEYNIPKGFHYYFDKI